MPYANHGVTPDGRTFYRTDGVLVQDGGSVLPGFIAEIDAPGSLPGDEYRVSVAALSGVRGTYDVVVVEQVKRVPWAYHQSTKVRLQGNKLPSPLFCFKDETPAWRTTDENLATDAEAVTQPIPAQDDRPEWQRLNFNTKQEWKEWKASQGNG